jgi:hypothetical protein
MYIRNALNNSFLNPFVHLVFILIESIAAKDVAAGKRRWCHSSEAFSDLWIVRTLGIPPGSMKRRRGVIDPLWARLVMEATKIFDRCRAKSSPALRIVGLLLRLAQRFLYQVGADVFGVAVPGVGKIS